MGHAGLEPVSARSTSQHSINWARVTDKHLGKNLCLRIFHGGCFVCCVRKKFHSEKRKMLFSTHLSMIELKFCFECDLGTFSLHFITTTHTRNSKNFKNLIFFVRAGFAHISLQQLRMHSSTLLILVLFWNNFDTTLEK